MISFRRSHVHIRACVRIPSADQNRWHDVIADAAHRLGEQVFTVGSADSTTTTTIPQIVSYEVFGFRMRQSARVQLRRRIHDALREYRLLAPRWSPEPPAVVADYRCRCEG